MTIYCPVCLKNPKTALACHLTVNCSERIWTSGHYYKNKSTGKIETGVLEWFPDVLDPTYSDIYMGNITSWSQLPFTSKFTCVDDDNGVTNSIFHTAKFVMKARFILGR